jgi:hypothetical protein
MCLGSLFIRQPNLILHPASATVIAQGLDKDTNKDICLEVLRMLMDFVLAGDEPAEHDADPEELKGASCVRNTVMQQYLQHILDCAYYACDQVAITSLRLVAHIYERGQVCALQLYDVV